MTEHPDNPQAPQPPAGQPIQPQTPVAAQPPQPPMGQPVTQQPVPQQPVQQQPVQQQSPLQPQQPVRQQLPHYQVHHTYIWLGTIRIVFSLFIALLIALIPAFLRDEALVLNGRSIGTTAMIVGGVIAVFLIVVVLVFVLQRLSYKHLWYELGPEEFSLYSGILNKKRVHVPYQRVQSVNQRATLVQRIFGVCIVHIDTAGGSSNKAVVVPYVRNSDAEWLRSELFARKQAILNAQAGVAPSQQNVLNGQPVAGMQAQPMAAPGVPAQSASSAGVANVLDAPAEIMSDVRGVFGGMQVDTGAVSYEYGLSNKELIFTGLSNNTGFVLMVIAFIGTVVGLISQVLETDFGQQVANQGVAIANRAFGNNLVLVFIVAFVAFFVFIWIVSIISTCISYGGFKARRRQNRIEIEHGLLQHQFHGVDIDRVQSIIIKQSFIRRLIGYCELSLGKIDAMSETQQEQENGLSQKGLIVHPFVKMNKVPEILAGLVPEFADVPTEAIKLPKVALRRAIIRRCILQGNGFWLAIMVGIAQLIVNLLASTGDTELSSVLSMLNIGAMVLYALCVVIAIIEGVNAVLWYRGSSFAFNSRFMQISNGGFSRESVSFPRKKIQFGYTKTNPFQRAAHVATVNARTAAGVGGTTLRLIDAYEDDAQNWLEWLIPRHDVVK